MIRHRHLPDLPPLFLPIISRALSVSQMPGKCVDAVCCATASRLRSFALQGIKRIVALRALLAMTVLAACSESSWIPNTYHPAIVGFSVLPGEKTVQLPFEVLRGGQLTTFKIGKLSFDLRKPREGLVTLTHTSTHPPE